MNHNTSDNHISLKRLSKSETYEKWFGDGKAHSHDMG